MLGDPKAPTRTEAHLPELGQWQEAKASGARPAPLTSGRLEELFSGEAGKVIFILTKNSAVCFLSSHLGKVLGRARGRKI